MCSNNCYDMDDNIFVIAASGLLCFISEGTTISGETHQRASTLINVTFFYHDADHSQ